MYTVLCLYSISFIQRRMLNFVTYDVFVYTCVLNVGTSVSPACVYAYESMCVSICVADVLSI